MPKLAETLRRIASEGADYMYTGAWARKFVDMAQKKGFCVSMEDMANIYGAILEETEKQWRDRLAKDSRASVFDDPAREE